VIADAVGASVAQLAIAWVLSRGEDIVPLIGARTRERLQEALAAQELAHRLTAEDLEQIEHAIPAGAAVGERYAEAQMVSLDSER
jgi:aryl-alcohol dehydrogenase-like predicted oxidoreductase